VSFWKNVRSSFGRADIVLYDDPSRRSSSVHLRHEPYISTLPTNQELLTPFQWTDIELSLVEGLNLGHAVKSRRELWRREWEEVERILRGVVPKNSLKW
jgi:hypothetical protein